MIIFDIETRPRLDLVARFTKAYAPFDPAAVKYGNTKDPAKRALILAEKEEDHRLDELAYWSNAQERAALNPLTAEIICIGVFGTPVVVHESEKLALEWFWAFFSTDTLYGENFVFWSGCGNQSENFDVDMIIRRSWGCGVTVPPCAFNGRYLSSRFVDAAKRYLLGKREAFCSLTDCAFQLGLYESQPDLHPKDREKDIVTGANFHEFWDGKNLTSGIPSEGQRPLALAYLRNDLATLEAVAKRIL